MVAFDYLVVDLAEVNFMVVEAGLFSIGGKHQVSCLSFNGHHFTGGSLEGFECCLLYLEEV